MPAFIDLTGQRFGRLTVLSRSPNYVSPKGYVLVRWRCACDCGVESLVTAEKLRNGHTQSCGCLHRDNASAANVTHGATVGRDIPFEYRVWKSMKTRCSNPNAINWRHYGGRGIAICDRWSTSFADFLADMGPSPSPRHSIERVDNARGYEPGNCVWATRKVQTRNTRRNRLLTIGGKTRTISEWAEVSGTSYSNIHQRLGLGWSEKDAVFRPKRQQRSRHHRFV
jgi:hypothetical protein